ncbi:fructose/tagatose bisphosphate aldolase [Streptomyces sp. V4I8]
MDLEITPDNINTTRLTLKRLTESGVLVETEPGLLTQLRP